MDDKNDPTVKWVRTRDRRSAELLADWLGIQRDAEVEILTWPGRDYAFRVQLARDEWTEYVIMQVESAQATNFKSEVAKNLGYKEGKKFLDALHDVWQVMYDYQAGRSRYTAPQSKSMKRTSTWWDEPSEHAAFLSRWRS